MHIARDQRNRADSFEGMVIYELTHVVQNYPKNGEWLGEGIADYTRHKYYEKDIAGKLNVGEGGVLRGYTEASSYFFGLQSAKVNLDDEGYTIGYTVTGEFLYWLERQKDPEIVRKLNAALREGRYSPELFERSCGAPLDELWAQFMAYGRHT
jgi:hypothetical protein